MAVATRAHGRSTFTGSVTSRTVNVDASAQVGDWLFIAAMVNGGTGDIACAGTTQIADVASGTATARIGVYKVKLAAGDLGGSFTVQGTGLAAGTQIGVIWWIVSGGDATDAAPQASVTFQTTPSTTRSIPNMNASADGMRQYVALFDKATTADPTSNYTEPAGWTMLQEQGSAGSGTLAGGMAERSAALSAGNASSASFTADFLPANEAIVSILTLPASSVQYARPQADVTKTNVSAFPAVSVFAQNIDEAVLDATDYVQFDAVGAVYRATLTDIPDPLTSTGHVIESTLVAVPGSASTTWTVELMVTGTSTVIASFTHTVGTTATSFSDALTGTQADSIGDYTLLDIRYTMTAAS